MFGCQEIQSIYRRFSLARRWSRRRRELGHDIFACYGSELVAEFGSRLWNSWKEEERELVVASSSASQALNLCAHHPHINSVHRFSRMVMRLGNLSHRICPNSFRALRVKRVVRVLNFRLLLRLPPILFSSFCYFFYNYIRTLYTN